MNIIKNKKAFIKIFLAIIVIFLLCSVYYLLITEVSAQSFGKPSDRLSKQVGEVDKISKNTPLGKADFPQMIGSIIYTVLGFLGIICLILIIAAGIMWMTAGGNEENITKAKGIIKGAVLGVIVILSAYAITFFVVTEILKGVEKNEYKGDPKCATANCPALNMQDCEQNDYCCHWIIDPVPVCIYIR